MGLAIPSSQFQQEDSMIYRRQSFPGPRWLHPQPLPKQDAWPSCSMVQ